MHWRSVDRKKKDSASRKVTSFQQKQDESGYHRVSSRQRRKQIMKPNTYSNKNTAEHSTMGVLPRLNGFAASLVTAVLVLMSNSSSLMAAPNYALSVSTYHQSSGAEVPIFYTGNMVTFPGPSIWNGTTYVAPVSGTYFFNVTFVSAKGVLLNSPQQVVPYDVLVHLKKNGQDVGAGWVPSNYAFAGGAAATATITALTGTYSCAINLVAGDSVQTSVSSANNQLRTLSKTDLTAFKIN